MASGVERDPVRPPAGGGYGAVPTRRPSTATGIAVRRSSSMAEFLLDKDIVVDVARYRMQVFGTWGSFMIQEKTVWKNEKLWRMMGRLASVSLLTALLTVVVVHRPAVLKVGKFTDVSKFLNVVTGLLLGFFLASSMNRWYTCVDGFLELLDSIRNLQIQFIALGVPFQDTCMCVRYGLLSGWLLYFRLIMESRLVPEDQARESVWANIQNIPFNPRGFESEPFIMDRELDVLRQTKDPPPMLWIWVAGLIGRLAQDGVIPPMASPTYGRIMNLCQAAHAGIRRVNVSIMVQYPLIYTHLMATLVHINNLLNAVTFGIVLGLSIGTVLQEKSLHLLHPATPEDVAEGESQRDVQTALVTFLYCCIGPTVYQALLIISMALAQPFDSVEAAIPLDRFLHGLEMDLRDSFHAADHMVFEKPCFAPEKASASEAAGAAAPATAAPAAPAPAAPAPPAAAIAAAAAAVPPAVAGAPPAAPGSGP